MQSRQRAQLMQSHREEMRCYGPSPPWASVCPLQRFLCWPLLILVWPLDGPTYSVWIPLMLVGRPQCFSSWLARSGHGSLSHILAELCGGAHSPGNKVPGEATAKPTLVRKALDLELLLECELLRELFLFLSLYNSA